jgi:hypothetical protein
MTPGDGRQILLEVDSRRRISLGSLARHDRYLVEVSEDGVIVLTPAIVTPITGTRQTRATRGGHHVDGLRDPNRTEKEEKP